MNTNQTPLLRALAFSAVAALLLAGCASGPTADEDDDQGPTGTANGGSSTVPTNASGCVSGGSRPTLNQAGSSTVLPIAEAWSEEFGRCVGASIVVGGGGSGAGIAKFCRGELDIADASRPIRSAEVSTCRAAGIEPFEIQVAIDGLAVVVSRDNTFVDHLTVTELNHIWTASSASQVSYWDEVRPGAGWPHEEIQLFGPGTDSGTFDFWKEVIIVPFDGASATTRSDYTPSEDDNVLVQGIASSRYALGYFGLAYVAANEDEIRAVPVDDGNADNGDGPIAPTAEDVEGGTYAPLARPLFMYTDGNPEGVLERYFLKVLSDEGQDVVVEVGYVRLPDDLQQEMLEEVA